MSDGKRLKPVGGIVSVAVVPAGTAAVGSAEAAAAAAVPLVDDLSSYDESAEVRDGTLRIVHRLTLAVPADYARRQFDSHTLRHWAEAGTAAVVAAASGERLIAGWSELLGSEQPLRLTAVEWSSGKTPHAVPVAILTFRSADCAPSIRL